MVASNLADGTLAHLLSLALSSGSPSKYQFQNELRLVEPTYPKLTLLTPAVEDHRLMPVPSSTSPSWMLNQLRLEPSLHNRFIECRMCSSPDLSQFLKQADELPLERNGHVLAHCQREFRKPACAGYTQFL